MEGLTQGRMVHCVWKDEPQDKKLFHRAAVITHVWGDNGTVNLHVFKDGSFPTVPETPTSVMFSEEPKPNTWHWIEKA